MKEKLEPIKRFKQILIPVDANDSDYNLTMDQCAKIAEAWGSYEDAVIPLGAFEIWEKDLETGKLERLR